MKRLFQFQFNLPLLVHLSCIDLGKKVDGNNSYVSLVRKKESTLAFFVAWAIRPVQFLGKTGWV